MFGLGGWNPGGGGVASQFRRSMTNCTGAAATLVGIRISRATTLRVSALFVLRALLSQVSLPLAPDVFSGLWAAAFAAAQSAAVFAAVADRLRLPGIFGTWGASLFSPADAPFVSLYGTAVLVLAPLLSLLESAVVVFEVVRLVRIVEDEMNAGDAAQEAWYQRITLAASAFMAAVAGGTLYSLGVPEVVPALAALAVVLVVLALVFDCGNMLHPPALSAYLIFLLVAAVSETVDLVPAYGGGVRNSLHSPQARAALLVLSTALGLMAVVRGPVLFRTLLFSADVVQAQSEGVAQAFEKGVQNSLAIVAMTFRFLVFHRDILPGEYYPMACRWVQVVAVVGLYAIVMRIEGAVEYPPSPIAASK